MICFARQMTLCVFSKECFTGVGQMLLSTDKFQSVSIHGCSCCLRTASSVASVG